MAILQHIAAPFFIIPVGYILLKDEIFQQFKLLKYVNLIVLAFGGVVFSIDKSPLAPDFDPFVDPSSKDDNFLITHSYGHIATQLFLFSFIAGSLLMPRSKFLKRE